MKLMIREQTVEVDDRDTWIHEQSGRRIVSHARIQKLGDEFDLQVGEPKVVISPNTENHGMVAITVRVSDRDGSGKETWELHEASDVNTTSVSRAYRVRMAWKRVVDKAILSHLGLYDIYSDIEAEEFERINNQQVEKESTTTTKKKPEVKATKNGVKKAKATKGGGDNGKINPKILEKISEIEDDLGMKTKRLEFSNQGEATQYLNDILKQYREVNTGK